MESNSRGRKRTWQRWLIAVVGLAAVAGAGWWVTRSPAPAVVYQPERRAVTLTVYSDDFALVDEIRPVQLHSGRTHLQVSEVSKQLDPQ